MAWPTVVVRGQGLCRSFSLPIGVICFRDVFFQCSFILFSRCLRYTNVLGADPDLPTKLEGDMRRVTVSQKWKVLYQFQHFYLPIIYGLLGLKVRISDITDMLMLRMNGPIRVNPMVGNPVVRVCVCGCVCVSVCLCLCVVFVGSGGRGTCSRRL